MTSSVLDLTCEERLTKHELIRDRNQKAFYAYLDGEISHERLAEILGISQGDLKIVTDKLQ